jgi:quinol monooxygenase YgiN
VIILAGAIRIAPDKIEEARPHFEALVNATRAEPGNISYSFGFDVLEEGAIRIFEVFKDAEALAAHRASPHMAAWRGVAPDLIAGERDMSQYDIAKVEKL